MEKQSELFHLPKITKKHNYNDSNPSFTSLKTTRGPLQVLLQEVKLQQMTTLRKQQSKKQQGMKKMENSYRLYKQARRKQKKKCQVKQNIESTSNDPILEQQKKLIASVYKYDTFWKPPHRYKTALAFYDNHLFLYGGFGCEKYLGLTKFSLKTQQWQSPKLEQAQSGQIALYGHTMGVYKHFLYVFGGIKLQSATNDLLQINFKTSQIKSLSEAPFRRKQHAMCFLGKYMIIHGGLQNSYEIKNTLFYFDTESGSWSVPQQYQMPYLSHHSMASISSRSKKKSLNLQDYLGDSIYIFGGKNQQEAISNKLFRLKVRETGELTTEEILANGAPQPRHSTCLQFIQPRYLCVLGGKSEIQETTSIKRKGIFNDICLFDIDKKEWTVPQLRLELPFRFGFSSCSTKNKIFIFGGCETNGYSDGCLLQLKLGRNQDERESDSSQSGRRSARRQ